jgi:hypothetical protein
MADIKQEPNDVCDSDKCVCSKIERERILSAVEKLQPYIDEQGVANWFKHAAYVRAINSGN